MREYIGNVCLDLSMDSDRDTGADDLLWDDMLHIVQTEDGNDFSRIIEEKQDARMVYHLSVQRQNILAALDIDKEMDVLEIGSECGALTGRLAQRAESVTCTEVSKKKSEINAWRNCQCENVEIRVGRFEDIHTGLTKQYDLITMVGTLEKLSDVLTGELSAVRILQMAGEHVKPGGSIVIVVNNKYGLKYWAGCRNEKNGQFFGGLKAYTDEEERQSYTLDSLRKLIERAGFEETKCYYPYPEYRFARCLYSDDYLPGRGELTTNMNNFVEDRLFLFNETQVYDNLITDGLFPLFSNSFLILCHRGESR